MNLFHIVNDVQAITRRKGLFRQVPVYRREKDLYVKQGAGFARLRGHPNTSVPDLAWVEIGVHRLITTRYSTPTGLADKFFTPKWLGETEECP